MQRWWIRSESDGDGLWSDTTNWSSEPFGPGGATVPTSTDYAIFDGDLSASFGQATCVLDQAIEVLGFISNNHWGTINFADFEVSVLGGVQVSQNSTTNPLLTWLGLGGYWEVGSLSITGTGTGGKDLLLPEGWTVWLRDAVSEDYDPYLSIASFCVDCSWMGITILNGEVDSWYSTDSGDNEGINFLPIPEATTVSGDVSGTGYLEGGFRLVQAEYEEIHSTPWIKASAYLQGDLGLIYFPTTTAIGGELLGSGYLQASLGETVPIKKWGSLFSGSAPPGQVGADEYPAQIGGVRSGDVVDILDPNKCRLTVNGSLVDFSTPHFTLQNISVSYDGKEVSFTEINSGGYGVWTFQNEHSVTLEFDFGAGLTTYFRGKIKKTTPSGANNDEKIQYVAYGHQTTANEAEYVNGSLIPEDRFSAGSQVTSILPYSFENNIFQLGSLGISNQLGIPGAEQFSTYLESDLELKNVGFVDGMKQIIQGEPDKRIFWDDVSQTWIFPNITTCPIYDLEVDLCRFDAHSYTVDTSNRYTAVRLWSPHQQNLVAQSKGTIALTPGWEVDIEEDWTIRRGAGLDGAADLGWAYSWVFRRWTFDPGEVKVKNRHALNIYALIPYWGKFSWVPLMCIIDLEKGEVLTNVPIVTGGNPQVPGDAVGPLAVAITYVDLMLVPLPSIITARMPGVGWEGTAHTWFGIEQERKIMVEPLNWTENFAQSNLNVLKDVVISAEIPIVGDIIPEFLNLQAKIRIRDSSRATGIDEAEAMLMRYSYQFGKPGKSTLSLSNDKASVTRIHY